MPARELAIPDVWLFEPEPFTDHRGTFLVWYDARLFRDALGYELPVGQTNHSTSQRGAIRGVHWTDVPPGQGKYVYCPRGAILDVVVDLRVGSPAFGRYEVVRLDSVGFRALYVPEGIGHSFIALADDTAVSYLCSQRYRPHRERVVNPMDPELELPWPADIEPILSDRDRTAPGLREIRTGGLLPDYEACREFYAALRARTPAHSPA